MDDTTCPHCGSKLPIVRDAFCTFCHEPLDEPPAVPRTDEEKAAFRTGVERESREGVFNLAKWFQRLFGGG